MTGLKKYRDRRESKYPYSESSFKTLENPQNSNKRIGISNDDDWSELPTDLIEDIVRRLTAYVDYVRFRAVCVKWRSSLPPRPQYLVNQFPWIMLTPQSNYGEHHGFYNIMENKIHRFNVPIDRSWRRCCGSSHGWLVLLEERGPGIILFNPITSIQIELPPITTFPNVLDFDIDKVGEEYLLRRPFLFSFSPANTKRRSLNEMRDCFIKKVVLSTSPTALDENYVALAIVDITTELAFCKNGDEGWTIIEDSMYYDDVIYYEGVFYAVHHNGAFAICDVSGPSPSLRVIKLPSPVHRRDASHADKLYLVDSFGELWMVHRLFRAVRVIDNHFMVYNTKGFEVVRLSSSRTKWLNVKSLGDRMLFLGTNLSLCLLATDFSGCDGNCIYYTGESNKLSYNNSYCNHDSGVFSLGDGSTKGLPYCISDQNSFLPPPVWLTPNP